MRYIIPNNLPELLPKEMTVEGLKKFIEQLIMDELDGKEALEFVQFMLDETGTSDEEIEICEYAVELARQKMIHQIKSA